MEKWYEKIIYPDGQLSAKLKSSPRFDVPSGGVVKERINSYSDLIFLRSIADIFPMGHLDCIIPCLFGQRSDRRFTKNQSFDLKIIADIINSCNFSQVDIFDPHSDVSLALINNSNRIGPDEYVKLALGKIKQANPELYGHNIVLVSPDAGAYKKIFGLGEKLGYPIVAANKYRDLQGAITLNFLGDVKGKSCLIVDDLCSRGGTFIALGKQLKEQGAKKVYLYISHFEGGCEEYKKTIVNLLNVVDGIYTTNSFRDFDEEDKKRITIFNI